MIKIKKPDFNQKEIIEACIENMREGEVKERIVASIDEIIKESIVYDKKAIDGNLSSIKSHNALQSGATKDDMTMLYERKFVPKVSGGREYYNALKLLAPNNRCPYCAQRGVSTLDHYLSKAKYPTYAVTTYNLVPSCKDCNHEKSDDVFSKREKEVIHPYYDDFSQDKWIVARMIEGEPIAFEFGVKCPETWDQTKKERAKNHFEQFKLNELYKPYAAEEYIGCLNRIKRAYKKGGKELAIENLKEDIEDKEMIRMNTWQAAMYQAIIDNEWFWNVYLPQQVM